MRTLKALGILASIYMLGRMSFGENSSSENKPRGFNRYETATLWARFLSIICVIVIGIIAGWIKYGQWYEFKKLNSAYVLPVMKNEFTNILALNQAISENLVLKNMGKTPALDVRYISEAISPQCGESPKTFFTQERKLSKFDYPKFGLFPAPNLAEKQSFRVRFPPANLAEMNRLELCTKKLYSIEVLIYITYTNLFGQRLETDAVYSTPFIEQRSRNIFFYMKDTKISKK
ncbi:hypothetical protein [Acidiphilium acidophilum]|uniref:hypothetical protein n=1 Tax=Acidiphilium acidophilum TaxID=76588 RepID=UPI002E8E6EA8|nr:hypothetical protein [Acidiphilium acidophilum]